MYFSNADPKISKRIFFIAAFTVIGTSHAAFVPVTSNTISRVSSTELGINAFGFDANRSIHVNAKPVIIVPLSDSVQGNFLVPTPPKIKHHKQVARNYHEKSPMSQTQTALATTILFLLTLLGSPKHSTMAGNMESGGFFPLPSQCLSTNIILMNFAPTPPLSLPASDWCRLFTTKFNA